MKNTLAVTVLTILNLALLVTIALEHIGSV